MNNSTEAGAASASPAAGQPAGGPPPGGRPARLQRKSLLQILYRYPAGAPAIVLIAALVVFDFLNPRLLRAQTISLMLQQLAVLGCLSIGQTVIMLTAGIDLSVGAIMIVTQMIMAELAVPIGMPAWAALLIGVAFGAIGGGINGGLAAYIRLPPFIVTLGTLGVYTAVGLFISAGATVFFQDPSNLLLWPGNVVSFGQFNVTTGVFMMIFLYLVVAYMLGRTAWGRHVYAVGGSPEASQLAGIRVRRLLMSVYVLAGVLYGIGAWIQIGRVGNATTNISANLNLDSITAVVIGGTSLFGGRGVVIGTLVGAMIVQVFETGLALAGVQSFYLQFSEGLLVIGAVAMDHWIRAFTTGSRRV